MSGLALRVQEDMVEAMKNREELKLSVLRMLKSALQLLQVEKGRDKELGDEDVLKAVRRLVKQRRDAAAAYRDGGAPDRAAQKLEEIKFLEVYLPARLSDEKLSEIIASAAEEAGAKGPKDIGKVMSKAMPSVNGRADGKRVRDAAAAYLASL